MARFSIKDFSLCFIILAVLASCQTKQDKKTPNPNATKRTLTANAVVMIPAEIENSVITTGTLMANEEVELRSEVIGRIVSINFQEGSNVSKGALLVKIDDRELQDELKKLQLDEKLANDDVFRKEKLLQMKAISQEEYDKSFVQLGIIQANIETVKTKISKTEVRAPFSGRVGLRQVSEGGYISQSTLIAKLQQLDPIKIEFSVPEKHRSLLRPGVQIHFRVAGIEKEFPGTIFAVETSVDAKTGMITARAQCPNPSGNLIPGAFAKINITEPVKNALTIPSEAIIPVMNAETVMVLRDGKSISQKVTTGIRTERMVQVVEGLNAGDTVFVGGLLILKDGMPANAKL